LLASPRATSKLRLAETITGKVKLWLVLITFSLAGFQVTTIGRF
jgi:hypothetical protein